jgi:hypothetical protein
MIVGRTHDGKVFFPSSLLLVRLFYSHRVKGPSLDKITVAVVSPA